ncbi:hypothetical protein [Lysobacter sp. 1R34A]
MHEGLPPDGMPAGHCAVADADQMAQSKIIDKQTVFNSTLLVHIAAKN